MSLNVYLSGVDSLDNLSIERDVEYLFKMVTLDGCEYDKKILSVVEKGLYLDNLYFIDRFGSKLSRKYISTGSKAALVLYHMPDVVVWGGEVGCDALTEIVKFCSRGALLMEASHSCIFGEVDA